MNKNTQMYVGLAALITAAYLIYNKKNDVPNTETKTPPVLSAPATSFTGNDNFSIKAVDKRQMVGMDSKSFARINEEVKDGKFASYQHDNGNRQMVGMDSKSFARINEEVKDGKFAKASGNDSLVPYQAANNFFDVSESRFN